MSVVPLLFVQIKLVKDSLKYFKACQMLDTCLQFNKLAESLNAVPFNLLLKCLSDTF